MRLMPTVIRLTFWLLGKLHVMAALRYLECILPSAIQTKWIECCVQGYLPYPVVAGFLAMIGAAVVKGAFIILLSDPDNESRPELLLSNGFCYFLSSSSSSFFFLTSYSFLAACNGVLSKWICRYFSTVVSIAFASCVLGLKLKGIRTSFSAPVLILSQLGFWDICFPPFGSTRSSRRRHLGPKIPKTDPQK